MVKKEKRALPRVDIYIIMCIAISFGGWLFEVIGRFLVYGVLGDRGFLNLPLCPIYGTSLLLIYLLMGTPQKPERLGEGLLRRYMGRGGIGRLVSFFVYFLVAALLPTLAELAVGGIFKLLGKPLWDYSGLPFNLFGVICLYFSLLWGVLITLFMWLLWGRMYRALERLPRGIVSAAASFGALLVIADFILTVVISMGG